MPRRSNSFQQLIADIEASLAADAEVSESKMLTDRATGEQREVDVYIRQRIGDHEVTIAVECRDQSRRGDVGWIEQIATKVRDLPVDKIVVVHRRGFTRAARKKAEACKIRTLTLAQASAI